MSNRWNLIANRDWRAVLIEGEEARFPDLLTTHGANARVTALNRLVGLRPPDDLDSILAGTGPPEDFIC